MAFHSIIIINNFKYISNIFQFFVAVNSPIVDRASVNNRPFAMVHGMVLWIVLKYLFYGTALSEPVFCWLMVYRIV